MIVLFILRGIPGSGKTTLAKRSDLPFVEADQFMTDENGNYAFDRRRLPMCHAHCRDNIESLLAAGVSCIVSNTNLTIREMTPYFALADKYGVDSVRITTLRGDYGSTHDVPDDVMARYREMLELVSSDDIISMARAYGFSPTFGIDVGKDGHDHLIFTANRRVCGGGTGEKSLRETSLRTRSTLKLKGWK